MQWKLILFVGATLIIAGCAQVVLIDNDINLQTTTTTTAAYTPTSQVSIGDLDNPTDIVTVVEGRPPQEVPDSSDLSNSNECIEGGNPEKCSWFGNGDNGEIDDENVTASGQDCSEKHISAETGLESAERETNCSENVGASHENETSSNENTTTEEPNYKSQEISKEVELDVIETENGFVQGFRLHANLDIHSYIDIPYGMFSGPFKAPEKPAKWEGIHEVREHQKRCPYVTETEEYLGEADCLTLSIFVPSNIANAAVLMHIHDGDLKTGSADPIIYGPEYLVTKGVILVLPNYRLGPLGFLCMQNDVAPGNAALKDLTLALKWIKDNIAAFGGNSSNIVVSGDGTAGALAGYLALSPRSRDFVSGVIAESGSMLAPWALDRDPLATVTQLVDILHENISNEINVQQLVIAGSNITFKPCVETGPDAFIDKTPWEILRNDWNTNIPFMIGSASHAGLHEAMQETVESLSNLNANYSQMLPTDLKFEKGDTERTEVGEKIKLQYFGNRSINLAETEGLSLWYTDAYYLGPAVRVARLLVEAGVKVYFYEFTFVGELNMERKAMVTSVHGAARGDIVGYTFTQNGEIPDEISKEGNMVDLITDLWVSFIQTGKPSANSVTYWNELQNCSEENEEWLSLDMNVSLHQGVHVDRLALWTEIYNNHYIDRNIALGLKSSCFIIFSALLFLSLINEHF